MSLPTEYPRLEQQIAWFDRRGAHHRRWYRRLKVVSIAAAAMVPLAGGVAEQALLAGALGVVVVIAEGLLHLDQHYDNWLRYRATCETLRREKYLYEGGAAHYAGIDPAAAHRRLVGNVEAILAHEGEQWLDVRQSGDVDQEASGSPPA